MRCIWMEWQRSLICTARFPRVIKGVRSVEDERSCDRAGDHKDASIVTVGFGEFSLKRKKQWSPDEFLYDRSFSKPMESCHGENVSLSPRRV